MDKYMGNIGSNKGKSDQKLYIIQKSKLPNFDFHSTQHGGVMKDIHFHIQHWEKYTADSREIKKFYEDLEYDHSFIQWIFPNFFNSMFNSDSYRLTIEERDKMIKDKDAMEFFFKNYKMFLRFLGIKWNIGDLELEYKQQFYKCLRINTHNQLRLKRVFASLSVLGQREEALKLLKLIHKEDNQLYGTQYYLYDHLKDEKIKTKENVRNQEAKLGNQQEGTKELKKDNKQMILSEEQKKDKLLVEKEIVSSQRQQQKIESMQDQDKNHKMIQNNQNEIEKVDLKQTQTEQKKNEQQMEKEISNSEKQQQKIESKLDEKEHNIMIQNNQTEIEKVDVKQTQAEQIKNEQQMEKEISNSQKQQEKIESKQDEPEHNIMIQNNQTEIEKVDLKQTQTEQKKNEQQMEKEVSNSEMQQQKIESKINEKEHNIMIQNNQTEIKQVDVKQTQPQQKKYEQQKAENGVNSQKQQEKSMKDEIQQEQKEIEKDDGFIELKLSEHNKNKTYLSKADPNITKANDLETITKKQDLISNQSQDNYNNFSKKNNNSYLNRNFTNNKRPQQEKNQYERFENQYNFEEIKNNYVQGDILNEGWVTVDLLQRPQQDQKL